MANCTFCKIVSRNAASEILYEDDEIIVFKDIKPAAKYHFLAIPKKHIENVNKLSENHGVLLQKLVTNGKKVIQEKGGDVNDLRLGFHLPPFNSVSHLHLHVISPASEMGFISRSVFKPNTWWFASVEQIEEKIANTSKL